MLPSVSESNLSNSSFMNIFTGFTAQDINSNSINKNYFIFWGTVVVILILCTIYLVFLKKMKVRR